MLILRTFSHHLNLSKPDLEALIALRLSDFLRSPAVEKLLASLDTNLLRHTLPTAKVVLAKQLPPFYDWLQNELDVKRVPDSPDHTTTWVVNFLNNEESLNHLVELHKPVPRITLERSIPRLIAMFEKVKDARVKQEWQKAIAALCLVLVVSTREHERKLNFV